MGEMRTGFLLFTLLLTMYCSAARAQQNTDMYFGFGATGSQSHLIDGTNIRVTASPVFVSQLDFGYQLVRLSSTSLWLDISLPNGFPSNLRANVPATGFDAWIVGALGARWMVPVYGPFSVYAVAGGGGGQFQSLAVTESPSPSVSTYATLHGFFQFGAGVDFRVSRWLSLRGEVRDLVTGDHLSGAAGRQLVVPTFGIAFHF